MPWVAVAVVLGLPAVCYLVLQSDSAAVLESGIYRDHDCRDFASQSEAQVFFERAGPGDPHNLDVDDDGMVCERLNR